MYKLFSFFSFILLLALLSCSKSNEADLQNSIQGINSANCDTSHVMFSADIAPILKANCNSCHNSTITSGGVITDNYNGVKLIADNGLLVGTITHARGFSPMPKNKPKLAECDVNKIKAWISQGTQNN
jgi:hypothetical protein